PPVARCGELIEAESAPIEAAAETRVIPARDWGRADIYSATGKTQDFSGEKKSDGGAERGKGDAGKDEQVHLLCAQQRLVGREGLVVQIMDLFDLGHRLDSPLLSS